VCGGSLAVTGEGHALACANRHSFDIARQGYVSLTAGGSHPSGDTSAMVRARAEFLGTGAYEPIAQTLLDEVRRAVDDVRLAAGRVPVVGRVPVAGRVPVGLIPSDGAPSEEGARIGQCETFTPRFTPRPGFAGRESGFQTGQPPVSCPLDQSLPADQARPADQSLPADQGRPADQRPDGAVAGRAVLADVGGGTGYYSGYILDRMPDLDGVLVDVSPPAARLAARAHPRLTVATADLWTAIPLPDASVDVVLVVFAPRNPAEIARILKSRGTCLVVTPQPDHLAELSASLPLGIEPDKETRLADQFSRFDLVRTNFVRYQRTFAEADIARVIAMGPGAFHVTADQIDALARAAGCRLVTISVAVHCFRLP